MRSGHIEEVYLAMYQLFGLSIIVMSYWEELARTLS